MTTRVKVENQIHRELMGVSSLNPWDGHDSSSRKQMFASHLSQALVINGSTERFCQTGMEREYGKYTFSIKVPGDINSQGGIEVIRVIERYPAKIGPDSIKFNPQTVVLYEDINNKEIGIINIPSYCSYHQYFGFEYKAKSALSDIRAGAFIQAGTILLDSPSITDNGGYKFGAECNMAFMSHPAVSEDGIMISRDVLKRFGFKTYENRAVEYGCKRFPLNLYGDAENYKPFPDIGDRIRKDGILIGLRSYDTELGAVEQGINDLMEPDFIFDKLTYAGGEGGRIVDIRVQHSGRFNQEIVGANIDAQADKYDGARTHFFHEIVNEYNRLKRTRGDSLRLTPEFHRLVVEALSVIDSDPQHLTKLYRQTPLDDYRIEFVIEYDVVPTIGFKMTGCHGNKGVICHIAEPYEMPIDENGNRADIVMDPNSIISRMNLGCMYEQYINAASRDVVLKITNDLQIKKGEKGLAAKLARMDSTGSDMINRSWDYLLGYYKILSPTMYVWFTDGEYKEKRTTHLAEIINNGIFLYLPPSNSPESEDIVKDLERYYRPVYGPVTYVGNSGKQVVTKKPVRIGSMYILLLEKTGDDWTAVSSGKLQHFGVLSQVTNSDKFSQPSRNQAIRALGESEVRIYASYCGSKITTDILDRNNNPASHKAILESILGAERPTNINEAIDRTILPIGGSKPLNLIKHMGAVSGWKFVYRPHVASYGVIK
jgi:DNA-directed RNA polymerase beta subunit